MLFLAMVRRREAFGSSGATYGPRAVILIYQAKKFTYTAKLFRQSTLSMIFWHAFPSEEVYDVLGKANGCSYDGTDRTCCSCKEPRNSFHTPRRGTPDN